MSTPAPSPPLPEWKPPRTSPLAGHRQVMPATVRVAPGGGVGVAAATGGAGGAAGAATTGGGTAPAVGRFPAAAVDAGVAGATPLPVRVWVVTGPNTGAAGAAGEDCAGATPFDVKVCVVTGPNTGAAGCVAGAPATPCELGADAATGLPAATVAPAACDDCSFKTWPGWITYGGGMSFCAANVRTSMPCANAMLYSVSPGATV